MSYLREGEVIALPCRWCASLSIRLRIEVGTFYRACPRCGELTEIAILLGPQGLEARTRGILDLPKGEEEDRE